MIRQYWVPSFRIITSSHPFGVLSARLGTYIPTPSPYTYTMVLSMLVAIIAAPGLLGSQEAIRQSQSKEKREEHRARRCNLIATCVKSSQRSREINGRPVVLRNGKLWIDTGTEDGEPLGHPYAGYYLPYPDSNHEGLVTTITDVAPIMNWVYIDKETHEAKYGVRVDAQPNLTGPFDCTRQDRRMTFDGWEGWCAVEEAAGLWALYFDVSDDGLRSKVAPGTRVLEVELSRKEKRFAKEKGERMQDQTTKRKVDAQEDAPFDEPLAPEALVEKPGVVSESRQEQEVREESQEAQEEPQKPRPFRIPKSIFENPPPMLEGSVFERPMTPPPAYSTTERQTTPEPNVDVIGNGVPTVSATEKEKKTDIAEVSAPVSDSASQPTDPALMRRTENAPPSKTTPDRSVSPPTSRSRSTSERRTTPKLNRSSGSRALAQAQKFEAMAAGQKQKDEARPRNARRTSRANSNGDSGSEYSRDSQELEEEFKSSSQATSTISPMPAPLATSASSKPKQLPLLRRADTQTTPQSTSSDRIPRPRTPPRQRAMTDPRDPAVFGTEPPKRTGTREPLRRPSGTRNNSIPRAPPSRSSSQASNQSPRPPLQRRGTAVDRTGSPRAPAPQRNTAANSPRTPAQPHAASRTSLASTMTSGQGNRAMTSRVSGSGERGRSGRSVGIQSPNQVNGRSTVGRKTTSALFREIDELVSQDIPNRRT